MTEMTIGDLMEHVRATHPDAVAYAETWADGEAAAVYLMGFHDALHGGTRVSSVEHAELG